MPRPEARAELARREEDGVLAQALGRLPWLALLPLRERRLRPRLDIAALLSSSSGETPGRTS
ncbi:hypothetical protein DQ240_16340 [Blastococcus sp. TF02A-26]|nr:hypothetical protein DQ240_16340 [Blastococcus sp. TF02A-26]